MIILIDELDGEFVLITKVAIELENITDVLLECFPCDVKQTIIIRLHRIYSGIQSAEAAALYHWVKKFECDVTNCTF